MSEKINIDLLEENKKLKNNINVCNFLIQNLEKEIEKQKLKYILEIENLNLQLKLYKYKYESESETSDANINFTKKISLYHSK